MSIGWLLLSGAHWTSRFSSQPLTILGVTGPFSVLAENIYSLCIGSFDVSWMIYSHFLGQPDKAIL